MRIRFLLLLSFWKLEEIGWWKLRVEWDFGDWKTSNTVGCLLISNLAVWLMDWIEVGGEVNWLLLSFFENCDVVY